MVKPRFEISGRIASTTEAQFHKRDEVDEDDDDECESVRFCLFCFICWFEKSNVVFIRELILQAYLILQTSKYRMDD